MKAPHILTRTSLAALAATGLLTACATPLPPHNSPVAAAPAQKPTYTPGYTPANAPAPTPAPAPAPASPPADNPDCPDVTRLHAAHLYGSWTLELPETGQRGQLTLRQHPEFAGSLRGEFHYHGRRSIASGDVEEGEFNLDESLDGKSLHAFWSGHLVPAACGAEIRGVWQTVPAPGQPEPAGAPFILRRQ